MEDNVFELSATLGREDMLPIILEPENESAATVNGGSRNRGMIHPERAGHDDDDTMKETHSQVPIHPISSMQGAFAESMREASGANTPSIPTPIAGNASERRKHLLDQELEEPTHAARWQSQTGVRYHQLWKLMAQISFGIYLLLNGIAKDDEQVMAILQGHVDEVDEFLETTLADFDLAQQDVDERLKFLKLPLENIVIFDAMLEDRNFRLQIVNGNERIEHVITRTATAMNDALKDVQQGLDACKEFTLYLAEEQEDPIWRGERPNMVRVFEAMKGNVEGWHKAYVSLQTKGNYLGVALVQLGSIVAEMDRRAGEVSRRTRFSTSQTSPHSSPPSSPPRHSRQMRQSMLKNLPSDPSQITPAIRATLPAFQMVQDRERTPEPERDDERSSTDSIAELEAPEQEFFLQPQTYSPVPSNPTPVPAEPEVVKKTSLRKRFSRRKEPKPEPPLQPVNSSPKSNRDPYWTPVQQVSSATAGTSQDRSLSTPPSRGLDSAYCSDFEKASPRGGGANNLSLNQTFSHHSGNSARTQPLPQRPFENAIPSPRSDQQQYFRPVRASPHSPLQRPWTAAPREISHIHSNSSNSNLSALRHQVNPSSLGNRRGAPSAMGMSVMSDMTMMTEIGQDGKPRKVKKKRSAFGWLKKAFSLSEEEKAAFEEKKRRQDHGAVDTYRRDYYEKPAPRWVDGRRVRSSTAPNVNQL